MRIDVFVIVPLWQQRELPLKTSFAAVVPSRGTPAVPAPVPQRKQNLAQQGVITGNGPPFSHCNVVRRIEGKGGYISKRATEARTAIQRIAGSQRVAAVLHKPQSVFLRYMAHGTQIEWIAQGMGHEDGTRTLGNGCFNLFGNSIVCGGGDVHKDRYKAELHQGRYCRGKARGHSNNFVTGAQAAFLEQGRAKGGHGQQIGRGAGVDSKGMAAAKPLGKGFFKGITKAA